VERLQKQTDDARYARDDELQRQKEDFQVLERRLVNQLEEQKVGRCSLTQGSPQVDRSWCR
jgi:hypothetical protein